MGETSRRTIELLHKRGGTGKGVAYRQMAKVGKEKETREAKTEEQSQKKGEMSKPGDDMETRRRKMDRRMRRIKNISDSMTVRKCLLGGKRIRPARPGGKNNMGTQWELALKNPRYVSIMGLR